MGCWCGTREVWGDYCERSTTTAHAGPALVTNGVLLNNPTAERAFLLAPASVPSSPRPRHALLWHDADPRSRTKHLYNSFTHPYPRNHVP